MDPNFSIFSTIRASLLDSVTPGTISVFLVFVFGLLVLKKRRLPVLLPGGLFIAGAVFTLSALAMGLFDAYLTAEWYDAALDAWYLFLALAALGVGAVSFRDWIVFLSTGRTAGLKIAYHFWDPDPVPSGKPGRAMLCYWFVRNFFLSVGAYTLGCGVAFMASAWPPNSYMGWLFYQLTLPGKRLMALTFFLIYGVCVVWPLYAALLAVRFGIEFPRAKQVLKDRLSVVQITVAGVFLAYGIAFLSIYYILKEM
ncbi:MAG: hypothetical protein Q8Q08_12590 [Candidatus Omnitrophota bacterium]|nr:hypothetical protein [Candidatus Omnitrophota bacterium]MDZ4242488.1 hypothetical protein [Candidatus Omnitrophota bacterium]